MFKVNNKNIGTTYVFESQSKAFNFIKKETST